MYVRPTLVLGCRELGRSPVDFHCGFRVKMVIPAVEDGLGSAELTSQHRLHIRCALQLQYLLKCMLITADSDTVNVCDGTPYLEFNTGQPMKTCSKGT